MKLSLKAQQPRNRLVVLSLQCKAGSHRRARGAIRQQARAALRREIDRLQPSP